MPAGKLDLLIEQGATFKHALLVEDNSGSALDLTGFTARMQLRPEIESADVLLELTTENGRITIAPLTGRLDLEVEADDTGALTFETAVYDLELIDPAGDVLRLLQGRVRLSPEVTREAP